MAVRIGIDGRSLTKGPPGVATVVRGLLAHIPHLMPLASDFPSNNFLWNQLRVPMATLKMRWNLYHAPSYTAPLVNFCPTVLSVHDVSYLASDAWYPYQLGRVRKRYYIASMKRAARIIVPSEFSRKEVIRFLPETDSRVRRIALGVSPEFRVVDSLGEQVKSRLGLPDRFLLHVGDIHPRRNIPVIESVAQELALPLVLVGKPLKGAEFSEKPRYLFAGVNQEELVGIYNAATVLVYPSQYEGFGLPILEAMACGLPVVAADRASIPEVCGEAAVLVEPRVDAILDGISRVLESRDEYVARGLERVRDFSWEKTAKQTLGVYEELL